MSGRTSSRAIGSIRCILILPLILISTESRVIQPEEHFYASGLQEADGYSVSRLPVGSRDVVPRLGTQNLLVIFIEFPDVKRSATMENILETSILPLKDYYEGISYGRVTLNGSYLNRWVTLSGSYLSYGRDAGEMRDVGIANLLRDVVQAVDPEVDFSKFRHILMIHPGWDQAATHKSSDIWSSYYYGIRISTNDGVAFTNASLLSFRDPVGGYVHEFGHSLGLVDLYDTVNDKKSHVGPWSLMDQGSWLEDGDSPSHLMAVEKMWLGWIGQDKIVTVNRGSIVNVTMSPLEVYSEAPLMIKFSETESRYVTLEYRRKLGQDHALPSEGVLLADVDHSRRNGPVRVIDFTSDTETLDDATINTVGVTFKVPSKDIVVKTLNLDYSGAYLQIQSGLADLNPTGIKWAGNLNDGTDVAFEAAIKNLEITPSNYMKVKLAIDGVTEDTEGVSMIQSGGSATVRFKPWRAVYGVHTVEVYVDVDGGVVESNEGNNVFTERVEVSGGQIVIDRSAVSKGRVDIGSVQKVYFHASWSGSNKDMADGLVYVNQTGFKTNSTGWVALDVKLDTVGRLTWTVTRVDIKGATGHRQTAPNPSIIWDKVTVNLHTSSQRVSVGAEVKVETSAFYSYDLQPFSGSLKLNDTLTKLNVGRYGYRVGEVEDSKYGLKAFSSNEVSVIFDKIRVTLSSGRVRADVGSKADVKAAAVYMYDGAAFNGEVDIDEDLVKTNVGRYRYRAAAVTDGLYGIAALESNQIYVIFDRVLVELKSPGRIEVGSEAEIMWTAKYEYDSEPFKGRVVLNDSTVKQTVSKVAYTVSRIEDPEFGLKTFRSDSAEVIFDQLEAELETDGLTPGLLRLTVRLTSKFDGSSVEDRLVINGVEAEAIGKGIYTLTISTLSPLQPVEAHITVPGFSSKTISTDSVQVGNIALILLVIVVLGLAVGMMALRRPRGDRKLR